MQEILADISTNTLATVDANLDLSPDAPLGQIFGIVSEKIAEVWELGATCWDQMDPDAAEGYLLDELCALTGTRRRAATYSKDTCTLTLNASTTVPAGSVAYVAGQPANRWVLHAAVTNGTGSTGTFPGLFYSEQPGPFVANAGTLTGIATPVIGWTAVTNAASAVEGIPEDTDAVLRNEREAELAASGSSTIDAIRSDLLLVSGVIQAFVYENVTEVVDTNGLPGHSFRAIIYDGITPTATNNSVAQAIWNDRPTGIQSYGGTSGTATDSTGAAHTVYFDRAVQVPIYVSLTTTLSPTVASTYRTAIKAAMAAYALTAFNLDTNVIALALRAQALTVPGTLDVPSFALDTHATPTATANIPIGILQIATLSSANILVDGS